MPLECAVHSSNPRSILTQLQVEYVIQDSNLRIPQQAFEFLFQLYNFVSVTKTIADRLTPGQNGRMLAGDITTSLEPFTSKSTKRRKDDGGDSDGRGGKTKHPRQGGPIFDQPHLSHALAQRGYHIQVEEEIEVDTTRSGASPLNQARSCFDRNRLLL